MRKSISAILNSRNVLRLTIILAVVISLLSALPLRSSAHSQTTVTITNNSSWEIRHIYLSPVDNNNWGPDQLNNGLIAAGGSFSLTVTSDQAQVKVITEDQDGCFLYQTIDCTGSAAAWTITSDLTPDCGS